MISYCKEEFAGEKIAITDNKTVIEETKEPSPKVNMSKEQNQSIAADKTAKQKQCKWSEKEYDAFVKTVRRHGKDFQKLEKVLKKKTIKQIRRYSRALCRQMTECNFHPEWDLAEQLEESETELEEKLNRKKLRKMQKRKHKKAMAEKHKLAGLKEDKTVTKLNPSKYPNSVKFNNLVIEKIDTNALRLPTQLNK